jgi:hypothetical protein
MNNNNYNATNVDLKLTDEEKRIIRAHRAMKNNGSIEMHYHQGTITKLKHINVEHV